jgi:PIN domain nuclease of toxin-antitoxin system
VVSWLYGGQLSRIPKRARGLLAEETPSVSPMVELELSFLFQVGRVTEPATEPLRSLRRSIGLEVADGSFPEVAAAAIDLTWTRDPFDRLIAAHAIVANTPLLTADRTILENLSLATWD